MIALLDFLVFSPSVHALRPADVAAVFALGLPQSHR